jgi:hypothetical protein
VGGRVCVSKRTQTNTNERVHERRSRTKTTHEPLPDPIGLQAAKRTNFGSFFAFAAYGNCGCWVFRYPQPTVTPNTAGPRESPCDDALSKTSLMILPGFVDGDGITRYAAFSVLSNVSNSLVTTIGSVAKHPKNPLFKGTSAWEHDIDNGYSSILHDEDDTSHLGVYRVYYSAMGNTAGTLYATSQDGLTFEKPALHRYVFNGDTANNILFEGATVRASGTELHNWACRSRRLLACGRVGHRSSPSTTTASMR